MIALDSSAIVAIAMEEAESDRFERAIASMGSVVGTPTLLETRLVLAGKMPAFAEAFLERFISPPEVDVVSFTLGMYRAASDAFERYGKGRGHPAKLNIGDCMAYAVAKVHDVPLLYKGADFSLTDIRPALP